MMFSVKQARRFSGYTQVKMAELMGVHRDTYRKIELYPESTTMVQAKQISNITGIPMDQLFFTANSTVSRI